MAEENTVGTTADVTSETPAPAPEAAPEAAPAEPAPAEPAPAPEEDPKEDAPAPVTGAVSDTTDAPADAAAPADPVSPTEPRARYRGKVVLSTEERTVGEQTFQHIVLDDGTEMDLTPEEHGLEVHISYPPEK